MSDLLLDAWTDLADRFTAEQAGVERGRMMSAESLTYGGKVFVFHSTKGGRPGLGCRLDRNFDIASLDLTDWQHLAPFKTRPPMKDWIVAGAGDLPRWPLLAETALTLARARQR
ncbi:MAG: hypothetical protein AAF366_17850 [Pseudomonadota bacterium]